MTISGHSIANYINSFHKTKVPTVILRCLMSQNLNWIISYDINYKLFSQLCFSILEEKKASKMAIFWLLGSFFDNYMAIFHKSGTAILRCLVCLNPNWIKSYDIVIGWNFFFVPVNTEVSFFTFEEKQLSHFQYGCFFKILCWFHKRTNQVKCK